MSIYLNFHTHNAPHEDEYPQPSAGLHPWYLTEDWPAELAILENRLKENPALLVGECGLDRLCDTPYERQLAAFEAQIALSEQLHRPLVLHSVKSLDDVLRLKLGTSQPWIWHGFRGKPQQLRQLLQHDFYISFGFRHNPESLKACPLNRLFLETDDDPRPIASLYSTVAQLLSITPEDLNAQLWKNLHQLAFI